MAVLSGITKAMVLAAGEGTRLRPLTLNTAKALIPIGDAPLVCHTLNWLRSYGISRVAINLHHQGEKVKDFLGDGSHFGVKTLYSHENVLLGTAGAVKKVQTFFDGTFMVVYGDVLTDFDISEMVRFHRQNGAIATIALQEVTNTWEVGIVEMDDNFRIKRFVEKPPRGTEPGNLSSCGVYVLEREVLDYIKGQGFSDFGFDVFPKLMELGMPVCGYRLKPGDYCVDIGTHEKYLRANEDMKAGRVKIKRDSCLTAASIRGLDVPGRESKVSGQ